MNESFEHSYVRGMQGEPRSLSIRLALIAAACAEPAYVAAMRMRNAMYDHGILHAHPLGKPAISVGNITTGGTGKTPVTLWLTRRLSEEGRKPAVLMRGYKRGADGTSDEQLLLQSALPGIPVVANPDRIAGAAAALQSHPRTDLFILDDAMQHRRAQRDFELVLINAANPFGHGRVFPRGLLREPLAGLTRAGAFLMTHASEVDPDGLEKIESAVRRHSAAPIFHADHVIDALMDADGRSESREILMNKPVFAFCGIGNPASFFAQLRESGGKLAGSAALPDHHEYTSPDLANIQKTAGAAGAQLLITTEKDWVKLIKLPEARLAMPRIVRAQLSLRFAPKHEGKLLEAIGAAISQHSVAQ